MLRTLTDDGMLGWQCGKCGAPNAAHVSHEAVQYSALLEGMPLSWRTVRLPVCSACDGQEILKVDFTEAELSEPGMSNPDGSPSSRRQAAELHRRLVSHLDAAGKIVPIVPRSVPRVIVAPTPEQRTVIEALQKLGFAVQIQEASPGGLP